MANLEGKRDKEKERKRGRETRQEKTKQFSHHSIDNLPTSNLSPCPFIPFFLGSAQSAECGDGSIDIQAAACVSVCAWIDQLFSARFHFYLVGLSQRQLTGVPCFVQDVS